MMRQVSSTGFGSFSFRMTPWVKRIIAANLVVFILVWSGAVPFQAAVEYLGFNVAEAWKEPWTIVTYMFVHAGFFHVFFNMLVLFFFGPPLEHRWGQKEFVKYYAICGVGGALFTLVFGGGTIVGASGAVYGVMLAYALNWPDALIWIYAIFPIKAKYLVLILGAISFFSAFTPGASDGIAHFAHLGGLVVGYIYLKKGWVAEANWNRLKKRMRARRFRVIPGGRDAGSKGSSSSGPEGREEEKILEAVDRLLDKIAAHGLDSLTAEERRFLDEVSRKRQSQRHQVRH